MAEEREGVLKTFGPAETPSTFAHKWISKFDAQIVANTNVLQLPTSDEQFDGLYGVAERGFEHIMQFQAQALELGLTTSDFPHSEYANPFIKGEWVVAMAENILRCFKESKYGENPIVRWHSLQLGLRHKVNDLLVKVEQAKERNLWVVTEELEQEMEATRARDKNECGYRGK